MDSATLEICQLTLNVPEPILDADTSSAFADIQARAQNQHDTGRKLRSGSIQARQASVPNDMADMVNLLYRCENQACLRGSRP